MFRPATMERKMNGTAQLVSMHDSVYNENYHIVVVNWANGASTTVVLDDNSKPLDPIPNICWAEIDKLRNNAK